MEEGVSIRDGELASAMSKARKEVAKKKSVAQKAATRAKKLQNFEQPGLKPVSNTDPNFLVMHGSASTLRTERFNLSNDLFEQADAAIKTARTDTDYAIAIDLLRQAIQLDPNKADYFVSLAEAYAHLGQHDFGLAACEMALRLAPENHVAARNRGLALKALGLPETTNLF